MTTDLRKFIGWLNVQTKFIIDPVSTVDPDEVLAAYPGAKDQFGTTFEEQTQTIRKWVNGGAVNADRLAVELLAWSEYSSNGMNLTRRVAAMEKAADLLRKISQP